MLFFNTRRSLLGIFGTLARRGFKHGIANALASRPLCVTRRPVDPVALEARIAARVAREKAEGRYDYVEPSQKPAARKRNGGLRGSTATRWITKRQR